MFEGIKEQLKIPVKERAMQYHRFEDGSFDFIRRNLESSDLKEKRNNIAIRAWPFYNSLTKEFKGYGSVKRCRVILGHSRDIIWDHFGQLGDDGPGTDKKTVENFITKKAEARLHVLNNEGMQNAPLNRMIIILGLVLAVLAVILLVVAL